MSARGRHGGEGPRTDVLVALFAAGVLAFNFPLLSLWSGARTVFGLPLLPVALFAIWAVLIAVLAWVSETGGGRRHGAPASAAPQTWPEGAATDPLATEGSGAPAGGHRPEDPPAARPGRP